MDEASPSALLPAGVKDKDVAMVQAKDLPPDRGVAVALGHVKVARREERGEAHPPVMRVVQVAVERARFTRRLSRGLPRRVPA